MRLVFDRGMKGGFRIGVVEVAPNQHKAMVLQPDMTAVRSQEVYETVHEAKMRAADIMACMAEEMRQDAVSAAAHFIPGDESDLIPLIQSSDKKILLPPGVH